MKGVNFNEKIVVFDSDNSNFRAYCIWCIAPLESVAQTSEKGNPKPELGTSA